MQISETQLELVNRQIERLRASNNFYGQRLRDAGITGCDSIEDFERLPFSSKQDLRDAYPLGLAAVDDEKIVRIHSSSGTTGTPVIVPYTAKDVEDWAIQFARCYEMAGITSADRIQITPGYGLWTAGIGFQAGAERLGAMAIPMGPGNTEKQLQFMVDMQSTVICATSSYALLLAEEIEKRGIRDQINLRRGVIGSERWGEIVITTLVKEGAPLIRFRTHDLSRIIPGTCSCGSRFPRIDTIRGRSDDMFKIHGVNVFPRQVEEVLALFPQLSSEYQVRLSHLEGRDTMRVYVETDGTQDFLGTADAVAHEFKSRIGFTPLVKVVELGVLPRSEKKTKRVFDERYE